MPFRWRAGKTSLPGYQAHLGRTRFHAHHAVFVLFAGPNDEGVANGRAFGSFRSDPAILTRLRTISDGIRQASRNILFDAGWRSGRYAFSRPDNFDSVFTA